MNYKSVVITRKGPPSVLQVVESPLRSPAAGEVRVKIRYTGVGFTDVIMRYGYYPYAPKIPFAPGYEIVGTVDALGDGVTGVSLGDKVAALSVHGGYAEYIYLKATDAVPVPAGLDDLEAVSLILNYVTAYQMLHREAKVKSGDVVLITGASGGVGNALLQLGQLAGLKMYGVASKKKHELVTQLGGIPIDYKTESIPSVLRAKEPGGINSVFDAIGGKYSWEGYQQLKRGGTLVSFGMTGTIKNGKADGFAGFVGFLLPIILNLLPDGKSAIFYGITTSYRKDPSAFREDLPILFNLLAQKKIKPVLGKVFPLLEAAHANELLEKGEGTGKLILDCNLA